MIYRGIKNAGPRKVHSLQPHIKKNQNPILKDVEFLRDIAGSTWLSLPTSSAWYNRVYTGEFPGPGQGPHPWLLH